jgi:mycothiol synthase
VGDDDVGPVTTPAEDAAVDDLIRAAEAAVDHELIGSRDPGGLVAWAPGRTRALAYAQAGRGDRRWEVELAWDRSAGDDAAAAVLAAVVGRVRERGGGPVHLWITDPEDRYDALAAQAGLSRDRDLWQLRRPLPVGEPWSLTTRPFVVGKDEAAWVEVNNRAFVWHAEQSGWTVDDVRAREAEPWFDPAGFLLHEVDGRLVGFCWTKVHADHEPPLGEIYVIAVDPDAHHRGVGRALVLAGLDPLAREGLRVGMLYVDADNAPANRLYADLGFTLDHVDRAFAGRVEPAESTGSARLSGDAHA